MKRLAALVVALTACSAEGPAPFAPECPAADAGAVDARHDAAAEAAADVGPPPFDAELPPAVCVSAIGGANDGGVVATCDAPGAFTWRDVGQTLYDCQVPCPRGAPCLVSNRGDWPGVCR